MVGEKAHYAQNAKSFPFIDSFWPVLVQNIVEFLTICRLGIKFELIYSRALFYHAIVFKMWQNIYTFRKSPTNNHFGHLD